MNSGWFETNGWSRATDGRTPDQAIRTYALVNGSPQERAGRDRRAEDRSPELLCPLLQHLE